MSDHPDFVVDGEDFLFGGEAIKYLEDRIKALEDVMSSGFQELSGRDVADALIDNANMRDRIAALEKKLSDTDFRYKMALHVSGFTENQINEFVLEEQSHS
jgi:hypothetical protein